jgi:hypothetical protein
MTYEDEVNCEKKEVKFDVSERSLLKISDWKDIYCLNYNYNIDNAFVSNKIAMQVKKINYLKDMFIISVSINSGEYPDNTLLKGVSVSLHSQGKKPNTHFSGILANTGEMFLIRMKKIVNEYLNNTSIESFDAKISTIGRYCFNL